MRDSLPIGARRLLQDGQGGMNSPAILPSNGSTVSPRDPMSAPLSHYCAGGSFFATLKFLVKI